MTGVYSYQMSSWLPLQACRVRHSIRAPHGVQGRAWAQRDVPFHPSICKAETMLNFNFYNPTRILFGAGKIAEISQFVPQDARVLVLYGGGSARSTGTLAEVLAALGERTVFEFGGIEPNPSYETLSRAVDLARAERIDFLLDNIRQMSDEVRQELALQEVSEAFKISVSALSKKLTSTMRRSYQTEEKEPLHAFSSIENHHEERNLLVISMQNVDDYKRLVSEVKDDYFINESYRGIFKWLRENVEPEAIESSSTLLDDIEDTQLRDALADLMFEEMQDLSFIKRAAKLGFVQTETGAEQRI